MDNADGTVARAASLKQILFDHTLHVARRDGVQVEDILDLQPDRLRKRIEGVNRVVFRFILMRRRFIVVSRRRSLFREPALCR